MFFHPSLSPFGYNETVANEQFPLHDLKEFATFGYKRSEYSLDPKIPEHADCIHPEKYSDEERKALLYDENILHKIIVCPISGRPFNLQKLEIAFYISQNLPLPKKHPDVRQQERL